MSKMNDNGPKAEPLRDARGRFKPGRSGNPSGRPRKQALKHRPGREITRDFLGMEVQIIGLDGKERRGTLLDKMYHDLLVDYEKASATAKLAILKQLDVLGLLPSLAPPLTDEEQLWIPMPDDQEYPYRHSVAERTPRPKSEVFDSPPSHLDDLMDEIERELKAGLLVRKDGELELNPDHPGYEAKLRDIDQHLTTMGIPSSGSSGQQGEGAREVSNEGIGSETAKVGNARSQEQSECAEKAPRLRKRPVRCRNQC